MSAPVDPAPSGTVRIFLAGDAMLGRGIDRILPHPGDPALFEGWIKTAEDYVRLAERRGGPIPRAVPYDYVWGDLLEDLDARNCDCRIVNLETAITTCDTPAPKGINYRMHPGNAPVLAAARIDAVTLANNHTLDWGVDGLVETLGVLDAQGIATAGAGRSQNEAAAPVALSLGRGARLLLVAIGARDSGIPQRWSAGPQSPGVNLLPEDPDAAIADIRGRLDPLRRGGDLVMVSVHRGANWGYDIRPPERSFARRLVEEAGVHIVHGHSSHHPRALEVHGGGLIQFGAGDLINDYEGIAGRESFRADLVLGYVLEFARDPLRLLSVEMLPYRIRSFSLHRAAGVDLDWLRDRLDRECAVFGGHVTATQTGTLRLSWGAA